MSAREEIVRRVARDLEIWDGDVRNTLASLRPADLAALLPEGWKVVPVEPTEEMVMAGQSVSLPRPFGVVYRAMLAAAPAPGDAP